jgi:hypothetical protein
LIDFYVVRAEATRVSRDVPALAGCACILGPGERNRAHAQGLVHGLVDATSYLKLGHVAELRLGLVATEERHIVRSAACWRACTRNEKTMSLMPRMMAKAATQAMSRTALRP